LAEPQAGGSGAKPRHIVAMDHRLDHADLGMGREQAQCMADDGGAMQGAVLLRCIASDAGSAPGRDHYDSDFARHHQPSDLQGWSV
jgi:hypothetical protein